MSGTRFTHTKEVATFTRNGFKKIGNFMMLPWEWACGVYDDKCCPQNNAIGGAVEAVGASVVCCCLRSPCACGASLVTFPAGGTAAAIFSVIGCVGITGAATIDTAKLCCEAQPANQATSAPTTEKNTSGPQVFAAPQEEETTPKPSLRQ